MWGSVTANTYNQAGQLLSTTSTPPGGTASTLSFTYDVDGDGLSESLNGANIAAAVYSSTDLLSSVSYPNTSGGVGNGTSLSAIGRDADLRQTGLSWAFTGSTLNDQVVLSESGRVLQDTVTNNGGAGQVSTYSYDTAGRLTSASIPGHTLSYGFGAATCGAETSAGLDGNRTSYTDAHTVAGVTSTTAVAYCYDNADRLTGTTVSGAPSGSSPVLADNLTTATPGATLAYDVAGETTTLADETLTYDSTGRHIATTTTGASPVSVSYVRDVTDRVVAETTGSTSVRFSYTGAGDSADYTLTTSNVVSEHTLGLPGGVTVSIHGHDTGSAEVWSYPNLHGDDIVTTNGTGTRTGTLASYDPLGDPVDPTTGTIGTIPANTATPTDSTVAGNSYGWEGSHQKLDQTAGDIATIEMGARQYVPLMGRFLSVDPVPGGNANDYNYPDDPVAGADLDGRQGCAPRACAAPTAKGRNGVKYFTKIKWVKLSRGSSLYVYPTQWAVLSFVFNRDQAEKEAWSQIIAAAGPSANTKSMYLQFTCHVEYIPIKPHFDLEPGRNATSALQTRRAFCNPGGGGWPEATRPLG